MGRDLGIGKMPIKHIVTEQRVNPKKLEKAIDLRDHMTPSETILWKYLRANRLEGLHFRRQQVIRGYIVDFYCHQANLVVEVDGAVHLTQQEYDHKRDAILTDIGLRVLRFTNQQVDHDLQGVLTAILAACRSGLQDQEHDEN
jgi:very-short-patch-repair endonuclease